METDSRDDIDNDDVVVWYTLSHDAFYDSVPMDGRNNYYIFNKGNITYTGSGHSSVTSDGEKKLFVNTLVAAYRTGLHAPKVYYKEAEYKTSATITSKYNPYDTAINGTEVVGYVGNTNRAETAAKDATSIYASPGLAALIPRAAITTGVIALAVAA